MEMNKYQRNKVKAEAACEIAETILYYIQDNEDMIGSYNAAIEDEMGKPEEERSDWRIESSEMGKFKEEQKASLYRELLKYIDKEWMIF